MKRGVKPLTVLGFMGPRSKKGPSQTWRLLIVRKDCTTWCTICTCTATSTDNIIHGRVVFFHITKWGSWVRKRRRSRFFFSLCFLMKKRRRRRLRSGWNSKAFCQFCPSCGLYVQSPLQWLTSKPVPPKQGFSLLPVRTSTGWGLS